MRPSRPTSTGGIPLHCFAIRFFFALSGWKALVECSYPSAGANVHHWRVLTIDLCTKRLVCSKSVENKEKLVVVSEKPKQTATWRIHDPPKKDKITTISEALVFIGLHKLKYQSYRL
jgi:hypothetical protein